jgi:hypothetical protein
MLTDLKKVESCMQKHNLQQLTGFVYELYNNKMTISTFVEKFVKANSDYSETFLCLKNYGGDLWRYAFKGDSMLVKVGYTFLLESNCAKDIGIVMLLADRVMNDIKDIQRQWKDLIGVGIMTGLASMQGYADCRNAFEGIRDIWSH